ncbi:type 2 periplasmic-binding domain-containing protein [Paraburkholderia acidisoli]|uniref:Carbohydrate ABC transporter substrate-binding protein n=1 Tax=Paraburkholderia acidisoli TaxID=2571748 RepID=A0A7Z2GQ38_9BURK|nr:carbohydrate ABC transporter substrate-binding protein [Paraburkholderia acidisoli]QGZ65594.1 carbohydrate ABC transporter substrate-binding protein [Paraburkholderia acidisoli]
MTTDVIQGLTWDHPRGFVALDAASRLDDAAALNLHWSKQPLEGFESHPIADLCDRFDLVVLDHPHIGEAVEAGCVWALDELFAPEELRAWAAQSVGPSYESYAWQGRQWGLPLDAATQVAVARADLIDARLPATWADVTALSRQGGVVLSVAGPHAMLSFCSMMAAWGAPPATDPKAKPFVDEDTALEVLDTMATIFGGMSEAAHDLNPIRMLEWLARSDEARYCPLIYGYVNYATSASGRKAVQFLDTPVRTAGGRHGSTLGGTGIALSRRAKPAPALLDHLRYLMSARAQTGFIPSHEGQPSHREAWRDASVNAAAGNFYRNTLATIEDAYVRPRCAGYIEFQTRASAAIRSALASRTPHRQLVSGLNLGFERLNER